MLYTCHCACYAIFDQRSISLQETKTDNEISRNYFWHLLAVHGNYIARPFPNCRSVTVNMDFKFTIGI